MTDTKTPSPSDAELDALALEISDYDDPVYFRRMARAVLARWGQPQAVAGGEPVTKERYSEPLARVINAGYSLSNCAFNLAQRPGTEISLGTAQTLSECRKEWDAACAAHKALPAAPPPQAMREPTIGQVTAAAKKLAECMDYPWEHMTAQGRSEMHKHAKAVIEAAHGITKGGQHGADN